MELNFEMSLCSAGTSENLPKSCLICLIPAKEKGPWTRKTPNAPRLTLQGTEAPCEGIFWPGSSLGFGGGPDVLDGAA